METGLVFYVNKNSPIAKQENMSPVALEACRLVFGNYSGSLLLDSEYRPYINSYSVVEGSDPEQTLSLVSQMGLIAFFADYRTLSQTTLEKYSDVAPLQPVVTANHKFELCQFLYYPSDQQFSGDELQIMDFVFEYLVQHGKKRP